MVQFKISDADPNQFVNRRSIPCPVCGKPFTTHYEGVQIDVVHSDLDNIRYWKLRETYLPYGKEAMCSERCATFYILSVMGPSGA